MGGWRLLRREEEKEEDRKEEDEDKEREIGNEIEHDGGVIDYRSLLGVNSHDDASE